MSLRTYVGNNISNAGTKGVVRLGRYHDAVTANERAAAADEDYIAQCNAQGLYPAACYPYNSDFEPGTAW